VRTTPSPDPEKSGSEISPGALTGAAQIVFLTQHRNGRASPPQQHQGPSPWQKGADRPTHTCTGTRSQPPPHVPWTRGAAAAGVEGAIRHEEEVPHGSRAREAGEEGRRGRPQGESAQPPPAKHGREEQHVRRGRARAEGTWEARSREGIWIFWGKDKGMRPAAAVLRETASSGGGRGWGRAVCGRLRRRRGVASESPSGDPEAG
jgi:hypothetical protein